MGVGNHEYQSVDWWMGKRANRVGVVVLELMRHKDRWSACGVRDVIYS